VITSGDHCSTCPQQGNGNFRRNPAPTGGILTIDDNKIHSPGLTETGQHPGDGLATGFTDNIAQKEQP
jgi:hypothetical protein